MAQKRMFTMRIIDSDEFLELPATAQNLYFHLNMRADDDGFLNNPKRIMRDVRATEDDLKILLAKRFLLAFENGVIVIKHWRMHNTVRRDRYTPTQYQEELAMLGIKDNGAYTFNSDVLQIDSKRITNGNHGNHGNHGNPDLGLGLDLGLDIGLGLEYIPPYNPPLMGDAPQKEKPKKKSKAEASLALLEEELQTRHFPDSIVSCLGEWMQYKAESHNDSYQPRGMKALLTQVEKAVSKYGERAVQTAFETSMANGWKGLFFDKLEQQKQKTSNPFLDILRGENGQD